ncbi:hypothetical protein [Lacticaseibacillus parakribbianus]|uniref:hypothetical protein n=1 Tax=Lacticaseibacillus parakribbianus TaxID=2970927 RepID=UPI0021CB3862|nr:hypothetical protein [Lacticaseibacillus parakribbianus]
MGKKTKSAPRFNLFLIMAGVFSVVAAIAAFKDPDLAATFIGLSLTALTISLSQKDNDKPANISITLSDESIAKLATALKASEKPSAPKKHN